MMGSRSSLCLACVLLAGTSSAGAAGQKGTPLSPVSMSLRINPDGSQSNLACGPTVAAALCPVLTKAVSRWKFAPGKRAGAPAAIDVWLGLRLAAVEKPGGFAIQATSAHVDLRNASWDVSGIDPNSRRLHPPTYPREELRRGKGALVIVEISRQPGSPHPLPGATWVDGRPDDGRNPFVKASRDAIVTWELEPWPAERLTACVPMEFTTGTPKSGTGGRPDTKPCVDRYADGLVLPTLQTDPTTAAF
jgi:hypothetical protein